MQIRFKEKKNSNKQKVSLLRDNRRLRNGNVIIIQHIYFIVHLNKMIVLMQKEIVYSLFYPYGLNTRKPLLNKSLQMSLNAKFWTRTNGEKLSIQNSASTKCIERTSECPIITHPGAAVDEGACDLQHVCVLSQLQAVSLQLLLVPRHLAQLHLQPLELLLQGTPHR